MGSHSYYEFEPQRNYTGWLLLGFVVSVLILALIFSSCSPTKRIGGLAAKHPEAFKRACAIIAPPEIKTVTKTEYLQGKEVIHADTVTANCDTVIKYVDGKPVISIRKVSVPCPPSVTRIDTVKITDSITTTDTKQIDILTKDLYACNAHADQLKQGRNTWRYIALGALVVLLGGAVLKLRKII